MHISDADADRVMQRILHDIETTLGPGYDQIVISQSDQLRAYADLSWYSQRLIHDVQQCMHDLRIDTTWPRCPIHLRHPLWPEGDDWRCGDVIVAKIGELKG